MQGEASERTLQQNFQCLEVPKIFTYQHFESNRYEITNKDSYESLCNNGFIKLYTLKTRVYWHAQNQFQHRVPDWKFHVSVQHQDLRKAWNLLVGLFIKMNCRAGMKTIYLREAVQPQVGRQITIYIVKYSNKFQKSSFAGQYDISIADEHSQDFWKQFIIRIQQVLAVHQIKSNGLAEGDLKIGNYVSLRNQAFVLNEKGNYVYPSNQSGWNHENHKPPFNLSTFIKQIRNGLSFKIDDTNVKKYRSRPMYYFTLPIAILTIGLFCLKKINSDL